MISLICRSFVNLRHRPLPDVFSHALRAPLRHLRASNQASQQGRQDHHAEEPRHPRLLPSGERQRHYRSARSARHNWPTLLSLSIKRDKNRADERTRTADLTSLRVGCYKVSTVPPRPQKPINKPILSSRNKRQVRPVPSNIAPVGISVGINTWALVARARKCSVISYLTKTRWRQACSCIERRDDSK